MTGTWGRTTHGPGTLAPAKPNSLELQRKSRICTCLRLDRGVHCYAPAAGVVTLGCIHEHLHFAAICAPCRAQMNELQAEGRFGCHYCGTCSEPHHCDMHELAWDSR